MRVKFDIFIDQKKILDFQYIENCKFCKVMRNLEQILMNRVKNNKIKLKVLIYEQFKLQATKM